MTISQIKKRDGSVVPFEPVKIKNAVYKAFVATGNREAEKLASDVADQVVKGVETRFGGKVPGVEDVQDIVEEVLMFRGYAIVAKAYIVYRQQRTAVRELKKRIGVRDDLKLSVNAIKVLERRYLLRDEDGDIIETPGQLFRRVAHAIASVETKVNPGADVKSLEEQFYSLMSNLEFMPNTPTLMNAGTSLGQLSACFVIPVEDSIVEIFESLKHMAMIHQSGGGTGFSFSRLRPRGDMVRSTKGIASGPVSFMRIFDAATDVIKQGGKRRGANMGILRATHPDIREFVRSKSDMASLSNFNISAAVTDEFMEAVSKGQNQPLVNPRTGKETGQVQAQELLDGITMEAWRTGDPGMIFLDEMNRHNPTPQIGSFEATNPCGELPLLPYESCNLGSINLSRMTSDGQMDWEKLRRTVRIAVRFLDDVIEANKFPIERIEKITRQGNRKIGLGVMGFADALIQMGIVYSSEAALEFAERLIKFIRNEAFDTSAKLAEERGAFPNFKDSIYDRSGSPGLRNATVLSIAPTGTISIIAGCSSGIEPLFALAYYRNVMEGTQLLEVNPHFEKIARERGFYSHELMDKIARQGTLRGIKEIPEDVRKVFVTDWDIEPQWHIRMQAVFQQYVDNSVSKTINLPAGSTPDDIRRAYLLAYELKCKGITVYRYGSKKQQVLYIAGQVPEGEAEAPAYVTAASEYSGGCPTGSCPF